MAYTIRKLLESKKFDQLKLLYGERGLDREVKGIRIIEIKDMERYLTGGDILLTSFQVYSSCSNREMEQHFEELLKKDISGFIVKKRDNNDFDKKFAILEKHCRKYHIPLLQIPENMHYWGIIRYVMSQVFDKDTARLKYFKITHDNFNTLALKDNKSENKIKDIIEFLGTMIENPIALYYSNLSCFASINSDNDKLILTDEIKKYRPNIVTKFDYLKQTVNGYDQYIVKVDIINEAECYLVITEKDNKLTDLDYMAIENAIINLQLFMIS